MIVNKIKDISKRYKGIIANLSWLSLIQVFNMLLPLITYPYLVKVLGVSVYGEIILAQTVSVYFSMLINFGLNISSTKDISIHRNDKNKLSEISSSVFIIKTVTWIISLLVLLILIYSIPYFNSHIWLYLLSFTFCFNELLFPQWFFQGIEKMGYITLINLITRALLLTFIFLFVNNEDDYLLVPFFNGVGAILGGLIGIYILIKREGVKLMLPTKEFLINTVKSSFMLFLSNFIVAIKDRCNVLFIGMFLGMHEVAVYDLATKIMSLFNIPVGIISNAIYPKISKDKDIVFVKKIIKVTTCGMLIVVICFQPFLYSIINYFVPSLIDGLFSVRLLMIVPVLFVSSLIIAVDVYVAFNHYRILVLGMVVTVSFYLICIGISIYYDLLFKVESFIIITLLVYVFEWFLRITSLKFIKFNNED